MNAAMPDALRESEAPLPTPDGHYDPTGANPISGQPPHPPGRPTDLTAAGGRTARPPARPVGGAGKWVLLLLVLAAVVIGGLLWKRSGEHARLVSDTRELATQTVSVTHPANGPAENEIVLPGNVMAFNEASIFARTNGYLKSWSTDIGAKVTAGQVLAEIEAPDVDAQLRQAKAGLEQAKSNLEIANLNFDREKDLLAKKVASQQEFDQNRTNVDAMKAATALPVTVKCRIGVDDQDPEQALNALVDAVVTAGVDGVIVHARKAWLKGLSPKENRDVPPLDYGLVRALKHGRPGLFVAINGGIADNEAAAEHLTGLDGVMLGRAAYHTPELLLDVDRRFFGGERPVADGFAAVELFMPYMARKLTEGVRLHDMTRHLLGLFTGLPGARAWRRHLATEAVKPGAGIAVVRDALDKVAGGIDAVQHAA